MGWLWIFVFASMGLLLEGLHGFKAGLYLDVGNEVRREMWTLAHTHGTLLGLMQLGFAATLPHVSCSERRMRRLSRLLIVAAVLLPCGFVLGGVVIHGGDPGLGILLVPVGALALVVASGLLVLSLADVR